MAKRETFFGVDLALSSDLCTPPPKKICVTGDEHQFAKREAMELESDYKDFIIKKPNYEKQYAPIYFSRLQMIRPWIVDKISSGSDGVPIKSRLIDVRLKEECWVVGTLWGSSVSSLALEDETGRASLLLSSLTSPFHFLCTGLVVGVKCWEDEAGALHALQLEWPGEGHQQELKKKEPSSGGGRIMLVGGPACGMRAALLWQWLSGGVGVPSTQQGHQSHIESVICLGGIVGGANLEYIARGTSAAHDLHMAATTNNHNNNNNSTSSSTSSSSSTGMEEGDILLSMACRVVGSVVVVPGSNDATNRMMPQQPLHVSLMPVTSRHRSLQCVSNPCSVIHPLSHCTLIMHSGQPLHDAMKHSLIDETKHNDENDEKSWSCSRALDFMQGCLRWRHLSPTCPDTLPCYPFDIDPFVLKSCPHVMIAAEQPHYDTRLVKAAGGQTTRIILLPSFNDTGLVVLLDPYTLQVETVKFDV